METISRIKTVSPQYKGVIPDEPLREKSQLRISNIEAVSEKVVDDPLLAKMIASINTHLKEQKLELNYEKHERTNQLVVRLLDSETKEIIREVPPQKLLDYRANMNELLGLLIDETI